MSKVEAFLTEEEEQSIVEAIRAVSYTHLDVYKRQSLKYGNIQDVFVYFINFS